MARLDRDRTNAILGRSTGRGSSARRVQRGVPGKNLQTRIRLNVSGRTRRDRRRGGRWFLDGSSRSSGCPWVIQRAAVRRTICSPGENVWGSCPGTNSSGAPHTPPPAFRPTVPGCSTRPIRTWITLSDRFNAGTAEKSRAILGGYGRMEPRPINGTRSAWGGQGGMWLRVRWLVSDVAPDLLPLFEGFSFAGGGGGDLAPRGCSRSRS